MNKTYWSAAVVLVLISGLLLRYYFPLAADGALPEPGDAPYKPMVIKRFEAQGASPAHPAQQQHPIQAGPLDEAASRLAARLAKQPDDVDGWLLLARTYEYLKRPDAARQAMDKAREQGYTGSGGRADSRQPAAASGVRGQVRLDAGLGGKVRPADTLFIYAKAVSGPGMPLAIRRFHASDLPLHFSLDDSMAMSPTMKLSGFQRVRIYARISRTGQAMPSAGDLQGQSGELDPADGQPVNIIIDHVL